MASNGTLTAAELGRAAMTTVQELTGYPPEAVTALEWDGEFWQITVDVLELARIPNTTDVIGEYVVRLDEGGTLRGYRRQRRFQRSQAEGE
jgi:Gas vesicle synthesis protein GvpO